MILGGGKLKLGGGNPPFPRVLYETLPPQGEHADWRILHKHANTSSWYTDYSTFKQSLFHIDITNWLCT